MEMQLVVHVGSGSQYSHTFDVDEERVIKNPADISCNLEGLIEEMIRSAYIDHKRRSEEKKVEAESG